MIESVGVLAYGSLIVNPGDELRAVIVGRQRNVMTPFNVEYARSSAGRRGAPVLVPSGLGAPVQACLLMLDAQVDDAIDFIYRREINEVCGNRRYRHKPDPGSNDLIVDTLYGFHGVDVVLYARIAANIPCPTPRTLARLAIDSARGSDDGRDGITYLIDAMSAGIATPLTNGYVEEIKRLAGADNLAHALSIVRAER